MKVIEGTPVKLNEALADRIAKNLLRIFSLIETYVKTSVSSLVMAGGAFYNFAQDESIGSKLSKEITKICSNAKSKFVKESNKWLTTFKNAVVGEARKSCASSVRHMKKEFGALKASTSEVVGTISNNTERMKVYLSNVFTEMGVRINEVVLSTFTSQNESKDSLGIFIFNQITKQFDIKRNRIYLFAVNSANSLFQLVSKDMLKKAGINKFKWKYSYLSKHPREYHLKVLKDNIYRYDAPPIIDPNTGERGYPSQLFGCKCYQIPVIALSDDN